MKMNTQAIFQKTVKRCELVLTSISSTISADVGEPAFDKFAAIAIVIWFLKEEAKPAEETTLFEFIPKDPKGAKWHRQRRSQQEKHWNYLLTVVYQYKFDRANEVRIRI